MVEHVLPSGVPRFRCKHCDLDVVFYCYQQIRPREDGVKNLPNMDILVLIVAMDMTGYDYRVHAVQNKTGTW